MYQRNEDDRTGGSGWLFGLVGTERVLVAYSDESGVGDDQREPITVVTAVIINMDSQWANVESLLMSARLGTSSELRVKGAFKGKHLYGSVRRGVSGAAEALTRVLTIPKDCKLPIFYGAVDRDGFNARYRESANSEPHKMETYYAAFRECLERVERAAKGFSQQRILWIAHRIDSQREPGTKQYFFGHRLYETIHISAGPELEPLAVIKGEPSVMVDTVYFGSDQDSIALQLADICCSTVKLKLLEMHYNWSPCVEPFYERIRLSVMNDGTPPSFKK